MDGGDKIQGRNLRIKRSPWGCGRLFRICKVDFLYPWTESRECDYGIQSAVWKMYAKYMYQIFKL